MFDCDAKEEKPGRERKCSEGRERGTGRRRVGVGRLSGTRGGEDHEDRAVGSSVLNQLVTSLSDVPWRM